MVADEAQKVPEAVSFWFTKILGIIDLGAGSVYALGPDKWRSSGNFTLLDQLGRVWVWAAAIAVIGLLLLIDRPMPMMRIIGFTSGTIAIGFWSFATALTLLPYINTATAGGAFFWTLGIAGFHIFGLIIETYRRAQEKTWEHYRESIARLDKQFIENYQRVQGESR